MAEPMPKSVLWTGIEETEWLIDKSLQEADLSRERGHDVAAAEYERMARVLYVVMHAKRRFPDWWDDSD